MGVSSFTGSTWQRCVLLSPQPLPPCCTVYLTFGKPSSTERYTTTNHETVINNICCWLRLCRNSRSKCLRGQLCVCVFRFLNQSGGRCHRSHCASAASVGPLFIGMDDVDFSRLRGLCGEISGCLR